MRVAVPQRNAKYQYTILMPLWPCRLYPGSAAILAASGAGETPALPGKLRQFLPASGKLHDPTDTL